MSKTGPQRRVWCVKPGVWFPPGWYTCGWWQGGVVPTDFQHVNH